ncbi:MAG TPA: hypothetical protein VJA19_03590 [Pseudomonas sp.]|nr:hypothetical protein [Pseudomonas sp.]
MTHASRLTESRWNQLWQRLGGAAPVGSFAQLLTAYGEPQRAYHTAAHIDACLGHFDAWRALAVHPDRVELALWTHDLVYDTQRQDNEAASAAQTCAWLGQAGLAEHAPEVEELILATRHQQAPSEPDAALVVDLDLSILASPPESYGRYEAAIRAEFAWVPEPLFRVGRGKVLRHLLDMPRLYQHPPLAERWEQPARDNLRRALAKLGD